MKKNSSFFSPRLMKGALLATCALFIQSVGYAQWTYVSGTSGPIQYTAGNVAIGTGTATLPLGKLDINLGGNGNYAKISFNQLAENPSIRFYRGTGTAATTYNWWIETDAYGAMNFKNGSYANAGSESVSTKISFSMSGNVLIGKTTQQNTSYLLDVNGAARANSLVVNTTGADFVFEKNYQLRPLSEVESFIKVNNHLPEIAPAAQMQKEGVNVGELQTQLLQKIEELTLYLIEQNKKIEALEQQLAQSKK